MKYRQIITFMLLGLFLNGCSTYRNYERPVDIRTDGLYGGGMTDSASLGSLSWRDLFTDSALQVLIEEGLANKAQRKNLRGKSDKFIYLLRNKISNNYGN